MTAIREAAELVGTSAYASKMVEANRYKLMADEMEAQAAQPAQVPDYREIANCVLAGLEDRKGVLNLDVDADIEEEIRQEAADNIRMMLSAAPNTNEQSNG